jgi:hypothetical protein
MLPPFLADDEAPAVCSDRRAGGPETARRADQHLRWRPTPGRTPGLRRIDGARLVEPLEAPQVIEELIALAKQMREADRRGEDLGLSEDELAFYDALETNDSAVAVLGDETLRGIARELVEAVRSNVTIDWTLRENVRAHLRVIVKRILRKHGYPPDKQEKATQTVLEQAEVLSAEWATA